MVSEWYLYFTFTEISSIACACWINPSSVSTETVHWPVIGSIDVIENLSSALSAPLYFTLSIWSPYIILVTDDKAYQKADIISVSGETNPVIQGKIRVTVENTQGKVIWAENVQVKDNGEFSTLLIGGGQGWEKNGQYALIAKHDTLETKTLFDFS